MSDAITTSTEANYVHVMPLPGRVDIEIDALKEIVRWYWSKYSLPAEYGATKFPPCIQSVIDALAKAGWEFNDDVCTWTEKRNE